MDKHINKVALDILNKHINFRKDGVIERSEAIEAMEEYAEVQSDAVYNLFSKPMKELKPLEDLWRKENPRDEYVIPDATQFYKWIRLKILSDSPKQVRPARPVRTNIPPSDNCNHLGAWLAASGNFYCKDCDKLFKFIKCDSCDAKGGHYEEIIKTKEE
jgi:hypothetical protein